MDIGQPKVVESTKVHPCWITPVFIAQQISREAATQVCALLHRTIRCENKTFLCRFLFDIIIRLPKLRMHVSPPSGGSDNNLASSQKMYKRKTLHVGEPTKHAQELKNTMVDVSTLWVTQLLHHGTQWFFSRLNVVFLQYWHPVAYNNHFGGALTDVSAVCLGFTDCRMWCQSAYAKVYWPQTTPLYITLMYF